MASCGCFLHDFHTLHYSQPTCCVEIEWTQGVDTGFHFVHCNTAHHFGPYFQGLFLQLLMEERRRNMDCLQWEEEEEEERGRRFFFFKKKFHSNFLYYFILVSFIQRIPLNVVNNFIWNKIFDRVTPIHSISNLSGAHIVSD